MGGIYARRVRRDNKIALGGRDLEGSLRSDFVGMIGAAEQWLCNDYAKSPLTASLSLTQFVRGWGAQHFRSKTVYNVTTLVYVDVDTWGSSWEGSLADEALEALSVCIDAVGPDELLGAGASAYFHRVLCDLWALDATDTAAVALRTPLSQLENCLPFTARCYRADGVRGFLVD